MNTFLKDEYGVEKRTTPHITKELIGQKLQTPDCPIDFWVRVDSVFDVETNPEGRRLRGFIGVDCNNGRYVYDNPDILWLIVPNACKCGEVKKKIEANTREVLTPCPLHGFRVFTQTER